ncbi:MAG: collagen-like protein, partial [Flavobacteriales bacterium]|nr:collagen-like protein [Flavobacteriales bacterium]
MRTILLSMSIVLTVVFAYAQAPQGINYQAVVRDAGGNELVSQAVSLRMTILENNTTTVYQETHSATTNDFGLVNLVIGQGTATQGVFADIDWSTGNYFAQTEVDVSGGTNYALMGSQQLMSVPYA